MIAALPMYDRPENRAAHDALWAGIRDGLRARGLEAPEALDRETPYDEGWGRPDLVLGQICNLPWRALHRGRVTVIGAADYGLPEAEPGFYYSLMVARATDGLVDGLMDGGGAAGAGPRMAVNSPLSCSGWDAPQEWCAHNGVAVGQVLVTGSHAESLRAVAGGRADLAGIDAITWGMLSRWAPEAQAVRVVGRTRATPGMTFITAPGRDPAPYREAVAEGIAALAPGHAGTLGLRGIVALPPEAYERPLPPAPPA